MKKILLLFLFLLIITGCKKEVTPPNTDREPEKEIKNEDDKYPKKSPVSKFTKEEIQALAIDFTGTKEEIATKIYKWQTENMTYKAFGTVSDAMRWNYFLPGIYETKDMIKEFSVLDNKKIEGLCYQFATIYCSIANYYELECRVMEMEKKLSEIDPKIDKRTTEGLSNEEYKRLEKLLIKKGYYYDYETIRAVAKETSAHYRAEVKINDKWVIKDATEHFVGGEYNKIYTFKEVDFFEGFNEERVGKIQNIVEFIDELGNKNRAVSIDEYRDEKKLLPYFSSFEKVADFLKIDQASRAEIGKTFPLYINLAAAYKAETGKNYYILADFIIEDNEDYAKRYLELTGEEIDMKTFEKYLYIID